MSNILVPLDGSEKDERAIPAAAAFADLAGGDLRLIRVLDTPVDSLSPRARTMGVTDAALELRGSMEQSVRGVADRLIAAALYLQRAFQPCALDEELPFELP